jgi:hypothetical protein
MIPLAKVVELPQIKGSSGIDIPSATVVDNSKIKAHEPLCDDSMKKFACAMVFVLIFITMMVVGSLMIRDNPVIFLCEEGLINCGRYCFDVKDDKSVCYLSYISCKGHCFDSRNAIKSIGHKVPSEMRSGVVITILGFLLFCSANLLVNFSHESNN